MYLRDNAHFFKDQVSILSELNYFLFRPVVKWFVLEETGFQTELIPSASMA